MRQVKELLQGLRSLPALFQGTCPQGRDTGHKKSQLVKENRLSGSRGSDFMTELKRFSVSLNKNLLEKFDRHIKQNNYPTRSKAISDLICRELVKDEWIKGEMVAGAVILVYDHHRRDIVNKLTGIQHDYHEIIISSQHVHLDRHNCFEIVIVKGKPKKIQNLANKLKSAKGVKFASLTPATTGKEI